VHSDGKWRGSFNGLLSGRSRKTVFANAIAFSRGLAGKKPVR
jgi:hypothetical protein